MADVKRVVLLHSRLQIILYIAVVIVETGESVIAVMTSYGEWSLTKLRIIRCQSLVW